VVVGAGAADGVAAISTLTAITISTGIPTSAEGIAGTSAEVTVLTHWAAAGTDGNTIQPIAAGPLIEIERRQIGLVATAEATL